MKTWIDNVGSLRSDMEEFLMITGLATHVSKTKNCKVSVSILTAV